MKKLPVLLFLIGVVGGVWAEEPVYFADENLKLAVEQALGITDPTPSDMLGLTYLRATGKGIVNLGGLEYATNLRDLYLDYNQISDISNLSTITSLVVLFISNNEIIDISPLSELTNLSQLLLSGNYISDVSALSGMTRLDYLYLHSNQISDISALSGLTNLKELYLNSNQISDISALSGLTKLKALWLSFNQISDISALSAMTDLKYLIMGKNQISDISALAEKASLESVEMSHNQISDISPLSGSIRLWSLITEHNQIRDISALSELGNLWQLSTGYNRISDVSALSALTKLTYLFLEHNNVSSITALSELENLKYLKIEYNDISDISALSSLRNLSGLWLQSNPLDCLAYNVYIPMIRVNNPGIYISYVPVPPECQNRPPVADAGKDQRLPVLFEVSLDGSGSYDPDEDYPLMYSWQIVEKPEGSTAELSNPDVVSPSLVPDIMGEHVIELVVTDSRGLESEPNYVVITAIAIEQAADEKLAETIEQIGELDPNDFINPNSANALINKLEATLAMLDEGFYQDALDKLRNDILKKTDGCAGAGQPDKNDWILTCEDQEKVYPWVLRAIELLEKLLE